MSKVYAIVLSALLVAGSARANTIFSTDFESGAPAEISGANGIASTASVNGSSTIDGNQLWQNYSGGNPNTPTTLTLTGLGANQSLDIDFTFLAIASWDGATPGTYSPDLFNVDLNSSSIFQGGFRNFGVASPEYPGCTVGTDCTSAINPAPPANTTVTLLQSNSGDFGTSIYDISITGLTADASGNATFSFYASGSGWQGGSDESIGLDNITVSSRDVATAPEPSTWVLIGGALLCLPLIRRRAFGR
jgi:hypothetical protein